MKWGNGYILLMLLVCLNACESPTQEIDKPKEKVSLAGINEILAHSHDCSPTITIRYQALEDQLLNDACASLSKQEAYFHEVFATKGKPVKDDNNHRMRANFYVSKQEYDKYATAHFNIPVNNGGMYLEGIPSNEGNEAEFIAYIKNGVLWNLEHEYVHYLDGRFNIYGDFCAMPHDSHSAPEYCPEPHPPYPHFVWWAEGVAEYISGAHVSERTIKMLKEEKRFALSELFNTSYIENTGDTRVYRWGYLAVRFMMENHRAEIERMLAMTRVNDWDGYRRLIAQWGTGLDGEFDVWLNTLVVEKD